MAVSYDQLQDGELLRPPADLQEPALTVNGTKVLERRYLHRIENRVVETPGRRLLARGRGGRARRRLVDRPGRPGGRARANITAPCRAWSSCPTRPR